MKILAGKSNKPLAEKIAEKIPADILSVEFHLFSDGEERVRIEESVLDEDVLVIQTTSGKVNDYYMELFFLVDAARRSGAKTVTLVIPYLGYQRQDHIFRDGEAVSLDVIARIFESLKVDKIITFDLHSIKIPEEFRIPIFHLSALPLFAEEIKKIVNGQLSMVNCCLVSPDMGGIRRIKILGELLNLPYTSIEKNRDLKTGEVKAEKINGNVAKTAIILDDMISTGATIISAANLLFEIGAEEIYVFATHPVFSNGAAKLLEGSRIEKVFVTDTIEVPTEKRFTKLEILSVADIVAGELNKR